MRHRIAIVIDPWDHPFNGTVVSTRRFVQALVRRGVDVRLLTIGTGSGADAWERVAFEPLRLPLVDPIVQAMRSPLARPQRRRIRAALQGCSLLHVQYPFFLGRASIREARRQGLPVICSFHVQPENILSNLGLSAPGLTRLLYRLFLAGFYQAADRVIAPSPFAADLLRSHGLRRPVSVVSNGVPEELFDNPRSTAASGNRLHILSVGRLAHEKDQAALVAAVAQSRFRSRIVLCLAGAGPREAPLRALAARLGVQASVGPVSDERLLQEYARADLFVHCGGVELEGLSVLEAMAMGNTVIVADSAASASPELVSHAHASFEPGNADELARRIDQWLDDPVARQVEGEANRVTAARYRHSECVTKLLDVYQEIWSAAAIDSERPVS